MQRLGRRSPGHFIIICRQVKTSSSVKVLSMGSNFVKISKQYFLNSSVHGLKYIAEEGRFLCERLLWLVLFVAGLVVSIYFTDKLWDKWQMTPAYIGLNSTSTPVSELFMPAITICSVFQQGGKFNRNRSQILTNLSNGTNLDEDIRAWSAWKNVARGLTTSDESFLANSETIVKEYMVSNNMSLEESRIIIINIAKLVHVKLRMTISEFVVRLQIGISCDDILVSCSWRGKNVDCLQLFSKVRTDGGFCCVMQEIKLQPMEISPRSNWVSFPFLTNISASLTSPNSDEPKIFNLSQLLSPISAGIGSGLTVTLRKASQPNPYLLNFASFSFVGYKVLVHSHEEYPEVHERGFAVPTQSETYVKINPFVVGTTEAAAALPVTERKCYNADERKLRIFGRYSLPNCLVECSTLYTMEKCGCCPFKYDKPNATNFCDRTVSLRCMKAALDEVRNNQTGLCGNCLITCQQILFDVKVANVPSLNETNMIYFYFPEESITGYIRDVMYDWPGFISAAGGLLGLGFGFSLLSAAECVYFYTFRWAAEN